MYGKGPAFTLDTPLLWLFTAYVIGNLSSVQLGEAMNQQGVSLQSAISNRDFGDVLAWLRSHVHGPGRRSLSLRC